MNAEQRPVFLDLNDPNFQVQLFQLEHSEYKKVAKTFRKIMSLTWEQVHVDPGLKWESIKAYPGAFSIRLSVSHRAVVCREQNYLRFISLSPDHDATYGRK